jgi:hypothetical protein
MHELMEGRPTAHRETTAYRWREATCLALASFAFSAGMMILFSSAQAAEDNTVTIVSWGGTTQDLEPPRGNSGMRLLKSGHPDQLSYTRAKRRMR